MEMKYFVKIASCWVRDWSA